MKRILLALALLVSTTASVFATAADEIAAGRAALTAHDMPTAKAHFAQAVSLDGSNQTAQALLGITRLFDITSKAESTTFLDGLGAAATGRNVYHWNAPLPKDANLDIVLPSNYNFSTIATFWQGTMVPESAAARGNLAGVTDPNFLLTLTAAETKMPVSVNIDYADVLMARACLRAAEFLAHLGSGQNLDANLDAIYQVAKGDMLTLQKVLNDNPNFLAVGSTSERTAAKAALLDMIALYRQASVAVRARPAGLNRLFMLDPADLAEEAGFRQMLDRIEQSVTAPANMGNQFVYTGPLFGATWSLRGALPPFTATGFDVTTIPDATLGGVVSGLTKEGIAAMISNKQDTLADIGWEWVSPKPQGSTMKRYVHLASGKHLITGAGGGFLTSMDGTNWTPGRIPGAGNLEGLVANAGKIVAAAYDGCIYVSDDDAVTWRRVFRGPSNGGFHSVSYGGGKYVAVGDYGLVATSTDGEAWNSSFPNNLSMLDVLYTGSLFVAVGVAEFNNLNAIILTSPDGANWTTRLNVSLPNASFTPTAYGYFWGVAQNGSTLVAVGNANARAVSNDGGLTWNTGTVLTSMPTGFVGFNGIRYSNGKFIAVGNVGTIATSSDGLTWATAASGESFLTLVGVGVNGGTTYISAGGGVILASTDNLTFTRTIAFSTAAAIANQTLLTMRNIDGQLYVAGGTNTATGGVILRSSDGLNYTSVSSGHYDINEIIKQGTTYYAVGANGTIRTSTDSGATWVAQTQTTPFTNNIRSIAYLNGQFVIVGSGGMIRTSATGAADSWTARTSGVPGQLYSVAYGNGLYVAVGGNNGGISHVVTSPDGITWTVRFANTPNSFRSVVFHQGMFTAVGTDGQISRSEDGINWSWVGSGDIRTNITSVSVLDGRYYATLASGSLNGNFESQAALLISSDGEQWVRVVQGTPLNANRAELFLGRIYTANNGAGILRTKSLTALAAPSNVQVTAPADTSSVTQGSSVALVASTGAEGILNYQWRLNGLDLNGETGPGLSLDNVQPGMAGSYTVVVSNAAGSSESAPIVVGVNATAVAPVITSHPQSRTLNVGMNVTLSVEATGTAPLSFQWKKDGVNVTDGGNVSGATTPDLSINNITAANAGTYTVVVGNSPATATTATSLPAVITVDNNPAYYFSVLAGSPGQVGTTDAQGYGARFDNPGGVAVDASGNVYVSSVNTHTIRKVTTNGTVTTIAGTVYTSGNVDAVGAAARFNSPRGLALDAAGTTLYVADTNNGKIRKIDLATGTVTTWVSFNSPTAIVVAANGDAYTTSYDHAIRQITSAGTVTIFAGASFSAGTTNGAGATARFNSPMGIALDANGNLYVADSNNAVIRKITTGAIVSTYAGQFNAFGFTDGPALSGATFSSPQGIVVDAGGNVLVADNSSSTIRKISTGGYVSTLAGQAYWNGSNDGYGQNARFSGPAGLATNSSGTLFLAENYNQIIRKGTPSAVANLPIISVQPQSRSVITGTNVTFSVVASGASALTYQWQRNGANVGTNSASYTVSNAQLADAGNFRVLITNAQGTALSADAVLTVTQPPAITAQPAAYSVVANGQAINLSVTASEAGATYQWRRNGFEIPGATGASFSLNNATRNDAGYYDVVINGLGGTITSAATDVRVAPTSYPGDIAFDPSFSVNTPITLSCRVFVAIPLASGKWLVGGEFVQWGATPRTFLARLNADYSLDGTFTPPLINSFVYALAQAPDNSVYVGGEFTAVNGHAMPGIFKLTPNGDLDLTWKAQDTPPNASVTALAVDPNGKVYVARAATLPDQTGTTGTNVLRRLNTDGTLDGGFSVNIVSNGNRLNAVIAEPGGAVAFAGTFGSINGTTRNGIARVDATGATLDTVFGGTAGTNNTVQSMIRLSDGRYVIGGNFGQVAGTSRNRVALLNTDGSLNTSFLPFTSGGINGNVLAVAMDGGGNVLVAGTFGTVNNTSTDGLVRVNATGAVVNYYPSGTTNPASSFSTANAGRTMFLYPQADGSTAIFGAFQAALNQPRIGVAVLTAGGTLAASPNAQLYRPAYTGGIFLQPNGQATVFGSIDQAGAAGPLGQAVRYNDDGSVDPNFPQGTGFVPNGLSRFGVYRAVRQGDGKYLVVGDLAGYNGNGRYRMMRINADGSFDPSFDGGGGPSAFLPQMIALSGGKTLLFNLATPFTYNGTNVGRAIRLNADGGLDTSFNIGSGFLNGASSAAPTVAYEQPDGKIVFGGVFTTYNGTAAVNLVRVNPDGSIDSTFTSGAGPIATSGTPVIALTGLPDGRLVVGGNFTTYNSVAVNRVVVLSSTGALDGSFTAPDNTVLNAAVTQVLAQEDGKFILIGDFTGSPSPNAIRLNANGTVDSSFRLRGITSNGFGTNRIVMGDDGSIYSNSALTSYNNGALVAVARFRGAASAPTVAAQPAAVAAAAGGTATLAVQASGTGPFTYQWRRNGTNIGGANSSILTLTNLGAGNVGSYDVIITGPTGLQVTSSAAAVTLGSTITFSNQPGGSLSLASGWNGLNLAATATSSAGSVTYQWQRNGTNLSNGTVNTAIPGGRTITTIVSGVTTGTLSLSNLMPADAGTYRCVVTDAFTNTANSNGVAVTVADAAPVVVAQSAASLAVTPGGRARIFANVTGSRPLTIQWKRNNVAIPGFNGSSFTSFDLDKVSAAEAGTYSVDISNAYGTATFNPVTLSLAGQPDAKDTWQWASPQPAGNNLVGVASGNGLLVTVGRGGTIISTTDGQSGNIGTSGNSNALGEVAYDPASAKFFAAGGFSTVLTSSDALTWTKVGLTGVDDGYTGIAVDGAGTVMIVGGDYNYRPTRGLVRISTDGGSSWNLPTVVPAGWSNISQFTSVAYGNNHFVVVGVGGSAYFSTDGGANWSGINTGVSQHFQRISYANGRFVAVGDGGMVRVSTDGETFTAPTWSGSAPTLPFYGVTYLSPSSTWVAVGGAGLTATSTDNGATWTATTMPGVNTDLYSISSNANLVLAVGRFGRVLGTANTAGFAVSSFLPLGDTPQSAFFNDPNNINNNAINFVDWDATSGQFLAVAGNGNIHTASADAQDWMRRSQPAGTSGFLTSWVRFGSQLIVSGSGGTLYSSADNAQTWSPITGLGSVQYWSLAASSNQAVVVGTGGVIYNTADGTSWAQATSGVSATLKRAVYANGRYVVVGGNDDGGSITILTSDDGTTWTPRTAGTTGQLWGLDYRSGVWLAVGSANVNGGGAFALRSTDNGVTWTRSEIPGLSFAFSVRYLGGQWLAVGSPHVLAVSTDDGATWSYKSLPAQPNINTMRSVAKNNDVYVVAGNDSIVQISAPLPATITAQPVAATVNAGSNPTVSVTAASAYTLTYQWRLNSTEIPGATGATCQVTNFQSVNQGDYDVVITATRTRDGRVETATIISNAATLTLAAGTSFSSWQQTVFTSTDLLDTAKTGPNGVWGLDGIPNLVKYALGLDPKVNATSGLPEVTTDATYWLFTYTRPTDRPDVTYVVQYSTNLTTWTDIAAGPDHAKTATNGANETWQARYALASAANLYFRLKITQ